MEADKWASLKEKLETESWPRLYLFKFIIPADNQKIAQLENLFNTAESEVTMRTSTNGNYVSISAKELMISADSVIERYKTTEGIEGLISL